jgi:hypothetical protein
MGIAVWLLTIQKQNGDGRVTRWLGACQWAGRFAAAIFRVMRDALRFMRDHSPREKNRRLLINAWRQVNLAPRGDDCGFGEWNFAD